MSGDTLIDIENTLVGEQDNSTKLEVITKAHEASLTHSGHSNSICHHSAHSNIKEVNWKDIVAFEKSSKGTEGLFFIDTNDGIVALKRCTNIAAEIFCGLLSMRLGVLSPKTRIIKSSSDEGKNLMDGLSGCKAKSQEASVSFDTILSGLSDVVIMQFIRGISMNSLTPELAKDLFSGSHAPSLLKELGKMLAVDVLSNNSDRLPLIWSHQGNFGNIMLSESGHVFSIDSKIIPIDSDPKLYDQYVSKVKDLLAALHTSIDHETTQFRNVRDVMTGYIGFDIGSAGSIHMQKGFWEVVNLNSKFDITKELTGWLDVFKREHPGLTDINKLNNSIKFVGNIWKLFGEKPTQESSGKAEVTGTFSLKIQLNLTEKVDVLRADENVEEMSWKKISVPNQTPSPRRYSTAVLYGGKMYLFGGFGNTKKANNDLYAYDFKKKSFTLVPGKGKVPSERYGHTATLSGTKMWIFGGGNDKHASKDDLFVFDFTKNEWTEIPKADTWPAPRFHHSTVLSEDHKKLYVFGGSKTISDHHSDLWEFDIESLTWSRIPVKNSLTPRAGQLSFVHKNYLWVFGGYTGKGGYDKLHDCHKLDLNLNTQLWEEVEISGSLPQTGRPLTWVDDGNGLIYVFGGYDGTAPVGTLHQLVIEKAKWRHIKLWMELDEIIVSSHIVSSQGTIPTPRYGQAMVLDNKGIITVFAGSGSMYLNDMFQIDTIEEEED